MVRSYDVASQSLLYGFKRLERLKEESWTHLTDTTNESVDVSLDRMFRRNILKSLL